MKGSTTTTLLMTLMCQSIPVVGQTGTAADFRSDVTTATDPVVHAEATHSAQEDTVAVSGSSVPQANWGIGGEFSGGFVGVEALAKVPGQGIRYGVRGIGSDGLLQNYGVFGDAVGGADSFNYGLFGSGQGSDSVNYGVYGFTTCSGVCTTYAVYADGDIAYTGSLIEPSDLKLKEDVSPAEGTLSDLLELQVVTYQHTEDSTFAHMSLSEGPQIGFIAQQVSEVFPDLVTEAVHPAQRDLDKTKAASGAETSEPITYQAIKPMQMIPILVKAVQEQQALIEALQAQIGPLQMRLAELTPDPAEEPVLELSP